MHLHLHLREYRSPSQWRWQLDDANGNYLADHEVRLDDQAVEYRGYTDLPGYLAHYGGAREEIRPHAALLDELGAWLGAQVFGGLREKLLEHQSFPATPIQVHLPLAAQHLIQAPLELAHLDGQPLARQGIRFIYRVEAANQRPRPVKPSNGPLRVLAVFSLPDDASPLNLRRERYQLKQLLHTLASTHNLDLELRVLQYGATRATLETALKDGHGWDLIHFSGHGHKGLLALEDAAGHGDRIETDDLKRLLRPAQGRLKLLTLSACHSGANLEYANPLADPLAAPLRAGSGLAEATVYPGLAQSLAEQLDCAVLAMRYSVGDQFATDLGLALYRGLLQHHQPLPGALQQALEEGLKRAAPPESLATPILFGARAADLALSPPPGDGQLRLDSAGLGDPFPPEPERFVGRIHLLLQANAALAPAARARGVLFHGMAGAGKTACALELAWRHERDRFTHWAWYKAPDQDRDVSDSLRDCLVSLEHQLGLPPGALIPHLHDPELFKARTLPQLTRLLSQKALCLCLDNLEGLLSDGGEWRVPLWGELMEALLNHSGPSRVILTSRRLPGSLAQHPALLRLPVHSLSLREANLLLRELEHTAPLFADAEGRELLHRLLAVVQGHPKLLELADRLAEDRAALAARLGEAADSPEVRAFFETGESTRDEAAFVAQLGDWAADTLRSLDAPAQALLFGLARMEEEDRDSAVLAAVWGEVMEETGEETDGASLAGLLGPLLEALQAAGGEVASRPELPPELAEFLSHHAEAQASRRATLDTTLQAAARSGLVELHPADVGGGLPANTRASLHPAIAERLRALAPPATLARVDRALGNFWYAQYRVAQDNETQGHTRTLTQAARRAIPYWLRREEWGATTTLLERLIRRDTSPATLAYALPRLEGIAAATAGTDEGVENLGVLASALLAAGRYPEAEARLRQGLDQAVAAGHFRLASALAGDLLNLLRQRGELGQALELAEEMAEYTRRAKLGPWTQLADEAYRLQILAAQGQYPAVLDRVNALRPQLESLPEQGEAEEAAVPWNVRETLLATGHAAALQLGAWEAALALNAEVLRYQEARGADGLELARTRYNDYGPLLGLGRRDECRRLLEDCRQTFAADHAIHELGAVYSALADLEDKEGHPERAADFERGALKYRYQSGQPEECAISHNNLANYLARSGAPADAVLAQRLAAAAIRYQTGSGLLQTTLHNLARNDLPPQPPRFAQVVASVEQLGGVRFGALFAALPPRAPDGDAAIAAVWERALAKRQEFLTQWAPLFQAIAAVAQGHEEPRPALEELLPQLEANGWRLTAPVHALWSGERDADRLTAGLDDSDSQLIRHILALLAAGEAST